MNLFPFVVVPKTDNKLTFSLMNTESTLPVELVEAIRNFEIDGGNEFEINECSDPEIVEFIIPAFLLYIEERELSEEANELAQTLTIYSAVFISESKHLVIQAHFNATDLTDDSDEDNSDDSDASGSDVSDASDESDDKSDWS